MPLLRRARRLVEAPLYARQRLLVEPRGDPDPLVQALLPEAGVLGEPGGVPEPYTGRLARVQPPLCPSHRMDMDEPEDAAMVRQARPEFIASFVSGDTSEEGPGAVLSRANGGVLPVGWAGKPWTHLRTRRPVLSNGPLFRLHRMDYPRYQVEGWQIGSGPIEAACKTVVNQRLCTRASPVSGTPSGSGPLTDEPSVYQPKRRSPENSRWQILDALLRLIAASLPLPPVNAGLWPIRRGNLEQSKSDPEGLRTLR